MLRKTVEWDFIMNAVKEKLREEGLEFVSVIDEEGRIGDGYMDLEVKVAHHPKPLHFEPGIRSVGGRGILDTPFVTSEVKDGDPLKEKIARSMKRAQEKRGGSSYVQRGPSKLRSTFAAEQGEQRDALESMEEPEDFRVGLTS